MEMETFMLIFELSLNLCCCFLFRVAICGLSVLLLLIITKTIKRSKLTTLICSRLGFIVAISVIIPYA